MPGSSKFPYEMTPLKETDQRDVMAKFLGFSGGLVQVEGRLHNMPAHYASFAQKYYDFEFLKDDVLIMTFPRSGTTWTQEIVWLMRNNIDTESAKKIQLNARSPFIEFDSLHSRHLAIPQELTAKFQERHPSKDPLVEGVHLDIANTVPSPRTLKTHLPLSLVNPKLLDTCKVVYVARNPKDACVSYYHQQRLVKVAEFTGDFADYVDFWCRDLLLQGPYWSHLSEAWAQRHHPNLHFLFYENMKQDIMKELQQLNTFLGTKLTEDQLNQVAEYTKFSSIKTHHSVHNNLAEKQGLFVKGEADFIRKGITGDWVNYFTPDLEAKFQTWLAKGDDIVQQLPFKYTL